MRHIQNMSVRESLLRCAEQTNVCCTCQKKIQCFTYKLSDDDEADDHGDEARNVEDDDDNDNHEADNRTTNVGINMIPNVL